MLLNLNVKCARTKDTNPIVTGSSSIKGQVKTIGVPTPCRVRLFEKLTGRIIEDKATDQNGYYEFDQLANTVFFIVAHHPASQYNAVIQDNVVPK